MKKRLLTMMFCVLIDTPSYSITPDQILSDDTNKTIVNNVQVRKGTIGALIVNAKLLNKNGMEASLSADDLIALQHIRETIKGVHGIGFFEMLPLKGWLSDASKPGNILVAVIALQEMPSLMTRDLKKRLHALVISQSKYASQELMKLLKKF